MHKQYCTLQSVAGRVFVAVALCLSVLCGGGGSGSRELLQHPTGHTHRCLLETDTYFSGKNSYFEQGEIWRGGGEGKGEGGAVRPALMLAHSYRCSLLDITETSCYCITSLQWPPQTVSESHECGTVP